MRVALAQTNPKLNKKNISDVESIVDSIESDVVVFPELSLNGYMMMDAVYDNCYELDELESIAKLSSSTDIALGCALKLDSKVYNAGVYFSDGEIVHIHKKNFLPNYGMFEEARYFFAGSEIEPFETKYGKAMMVVCEDLWSAVTIDKIVSESPEIVYVLTASPSRDFLDDGSMLIEDKWTSILKTTSILSGANIVFVNRVGFEDGIGFWGGSRVVSANCTIIEKLPLFEESTKVVEIDSSLSKAQKYMLRHK
jgi:predicted amidohydrolase